MQNRENQETEEVGSLFSPPSFPYNSSLQQQTSHTLDTAPAELKTEEVERPEKDTYY